MISRRTLKGGIEEVRPAFNHSASTGANSHGERTWEREQIIAQMVEDIRNVLEQIRDKQMLQCDVRGEIFSLLREARRTNRLLERIAGKPKKRGRDSQ